MKLLKDIFFTKKSITAIIIICLILLLAITISTAYHSWLTRYMADNYIQIETTDTNQALIHDVIGSTLYLSNPYNYDLEIIRVNIEGINCEVEGVAKPGMNEYDVLSCAYKITEPAVEVVVYTNKHVYSKYVFIDKIRLPSGAILGGSDCSLLYNIEKNMKGTYYLTGDINCIDSKTWNNGSGFDPIGNESVSFQGTLNGNGYTIYNLYMNHSEKESGMFGSLDGALIKNLNFDLISINGLKKSSGALAGMGKNSTIINVNVKGDITGDRKSVGGIIGELQNSIMKRCSYKNGTVTGDRKSVGGIIGICENSEIHNSFSTGNVVGIKDASGGLIGYLKDSLVNCSYSTGSVYSGEGIEGGLVGDILASTVIYSYWDMETSNLSVSSAGAGLFTSEMKDSSTYSNWNSNIWNITDGNYPKFK